MLQGAGGRKTVSTSQGQASQAVSSFQEAMLPTTQETPAAQLAHLLGSLTAKESVALAPAPTSSASLATRVDSGTCPGGKRCIDLQRRGAGELRWTSAAQEGHKFL